MLSRPKGCRTGLLGLLGIGLPVMGQPADNDNVADDAQALRQFETLTEEFKQLGDWQQQAEIIQSFMDRLWRENGWNSVADEFAKRAMTEVAGIPPWDFAGRMSRFTNLIGERYEFDDKQRQRLESSLYAETGWFLVKNFKTVWNQTRETISTRAAGRPFTPEQVAQWASEADELVADAHERMERIAHSMEKTMTPEQRRLLREDLESYARRRAFVDQMRERWVKGGWRPEDWGLERDPIQNQGSPAAGLPSSRPAPASQPAPAERQAIRIDDETTWERYVRAFIARHQLDAAQRATAWSILREMQTRALNHRTARRADGVPPEGEASSAESASAPLQRMFEELTARLEAIPTDAQKAAAQLRGP